MRVRATLAASALVLGACSSITGESAKGPGQYTGQPTQPPPIALSITTSSLAAATVGQTYYEVMSAQGGAVPYRWTVYTGALPPGLTLELTSGIISGTPSAGGSYTFTVNVATPAGTAQKIFTLDVQ